MRAITNKNIIKQICIIYRHPFSETFGETELLQTSFFYHNLKKSYFLEWNNFQLLPFTYLGLKKRMSKII